MRVLNEIFKNKIVLTSILSWLLAQTLKIIIYIINNKKFTIERIFGAGGMPSSHSALVCSTCIATFKQCGPDSAAFAISLILAGIVMYDAMGVRRAAGEQAKIINKVIISPLKENSNTTSEEYHNNYLNENISLKALKEFLGHTPLEVLGGAILGITMGIVIN